VSDACDASDVAYSRQDEASLVKVVKLTLGNVSCVGEDASHIVFVFRTSEITSGLDTVLGTRGAHFFRANRLVIP
jgi:hypothetical protein